MPKAKATAERRLVVANPNATPKDFPILEYRDGLRFFEGDPWVRPERTSLEIEDKLIDKGYLVELVRG